MARRLSALVIAIVCAATAAALGGSAATNNAAAFGWRGYADTDLQFSEFYGSNHTLSVRFMLQYPNAYTGPILSVDGSGAFFRGEGLQSVPSAGQHGRKRCNS